MQRTLDLSGVEWIKNYGYTESAVVGTPYETMVKNGSGYRICSGLVEVPKEVLHVSVADGFQWAWCGFDADGGYLRKYILWTADSGDIDCTTDIEQIALFVRRGSGSSALLPEDWAESEITAIFEGGGTT